MSIHIIIIGGGLAGLATALAVKNENAGHLVTILESVPKYEDIGAGLQLTPNATRLFRRWGIFDDLSQKATAHKGLTVRRYDGSVTLAHESHFQEKILSRFHAPFWGMHRVDLQNILVARCKELGVSIRFGSRVVFVDFENAEVEFESAGRNKFKGDVVVCTDGIWSTMRTQFLGTQSIARPTGDLAYRIMIDTSELKGPDALELRRFIQAEETNFWVGPGSHVVAYAVRNTNLYNIVLLCHDDLPEGITRMGGNLQEMKKLFEGWDPLLRKFLDQVEATAKWKLSYLDTKDIPTWKNAKGTFIMAGDSCHAMLPYLAQGANTSLEDGAILGYLLGKVCQSSKEGQLQRAAELYQNLRKERVEMIQRESFDQRTAFHLPDGLEQAARDELMIKMLHSSIIGKFPSRWTCPVVQEWLYGYEAFAIAEQSFEASPF